MTLRRHVIGVFSFAFAYMAASVGLAVSRGNSEFIFYILVMLVLVAAISWVHARVCLSPGLLWALAVWGFLHMAGGLLPLPEGWPYDGEHAVFYSWWMVPPHYLKYDQVVHAYGFGVTTWLCWHALRAAITGFGVHRQVVHPTFGLLTLCVAAGVGFGALNEVIEFIAVLSLPETNVGGYENLGWDLIANLVGAIVAAICIRIFSGARPTSRAPEERTGP